LPQCLADYPFWKIHVKSILVLITYTRAIFTADDMLNTLALPQTTDIDEITRRNFLDSQALTVLNFTLLDNLLIHGQSNAEALWAHFWTLMGIPGPVLIFADYQRIIISQISSNQNFVSQITELI